MSAVDKVLAALDAGLQRSEEHGYPERVDDPTRCARCLIHAPAQDADLCSGCRAYLLGDSDADPRHRPHREEHVPVLCGCARCRAEALAEGMQSYMGDLAREYTIAVPEWYAVTCDRCHAIYACDPARTEDAAAIMRADGHGRGGECAMEHASEPPYESGDALTRRRDWQAEAWRHYEQTRDDALERVAVGLDIPRELLEDVRANPAPYDWAQEAQTRAEEWTAEFRRYVRGQRW